MLPDGVADDIAVAMIGTDRTAMAILDAARIEDDDVVLDGVGGEAGRAAFELLGRGACPVRLVCR